MTNKNIFISTTLFLALIFVAGISMYKSKQTSKVASELLPILERIDAPVKGGKQAKVTIVEFFDPACETCRQFSPLLNNIVKKYQGRVKLVMRYTPLHKGSEDVVKMLEAAHLQGQFWPALELLFTNQERWTRHHVANPQSALAAIKTLDLDHDKLEKDWQSSKVAKTIAQDIADGKTLKVRATPQFFVNGKPLIIFGYDELVSLVEEAVAEAY